MAKVIKYVAGGIRKLEDALPQSIRRPAERLRHGVARKTFTLRGASPTPTPKAVYRCEGEHVFFGYYDKCPESMDGSTVVAHRTASGSDSSTITLFDAPTGRPIRDLGNTRLWSWQLGARLQWLPDCSDTVLYNSETSAQGGAVLVNVGDGAVAASFKSCIYDVAPSGDFGLGLDFGRLAIGRPGYGYDAIKGREATEGIVRTNLKTGTESQLVSIDQLMAHLPVDAREKFIYLNHISISPDGERFFFLCLWFDQSTNDPENLSSCAFVARTDGTGLATIEKSARTSHYAWLDATHILVYIFDADDRGFFLYDVESQTREKFWSHLPVNDGHQSFSADRTTLLVDTYPSWLTGQQDLALFFQGGGAERIGAFATDGRFGGPERCDLHPRFSRDEKSVFIDSTHEGNRALYRIGIARQ